MAVIALDALAVLGVEHAAGGVGRPTFLPAAGRVAAQAEITTTIDSQRFRVLRVVEGGAVAIFTGDHDMGRSSETGAVVLMAIGAITALLVFGGKIAFMIKDYIDRKFMKQFQAIEKTL